MYWKSWMLLNFCEEMRSDFDIWPGVLTYVKRAFPSTIMNDQPHVYIICFQWSRLPPTPWRWYLKHPRKRLSREMAWGPVGAAKSVFYTNLPLRAFVSCPIKAFCPQRGHLGADFEAAKSVSQTSFLPFPIQLHKLNYHTSQVECYRWHHRDS